MTIQTTENRVNYTGDGSNLGPFAFNFVTLDTLHIIVFLDSVLQGSGFSVTLNADQGLTPGGNVTFIVAPGNGVVITIQREVPLTQLTDYQPYDPFPAETHENALDLAAMGRQQLQDELDRSLKAGVSTPPGTIYTLPNPEADRALIWNPTADNIINGPTAGEINAAEGHANNAAASASAASGSEINAGASENKAQQWAEEPEDSPVEPGEFSALHHAAKAAASAATIIMPRGHLWGLALTRLDANTITFEAGEARDQVNVQNMVLAAPLNKDTDAVWLQGAGGGAFTPGAASTWMHCFIIRQDSDGAIDAGFDTDVNGANIPAGWTAYRRVGSIYLNISDADIDDFSQNGDLFTWRTIEYDYEISNPGTGGNLRTIRVPLGINIIANHTHNLDAETTTNLYCLVTSPDQTDSVPSIAFFNQQTHTSISRYESTEFVLKTNNLSQIRVRLSVSGVNDKSRGITSSYIDNRGRA